MSEHRVPEFRKPLAVSRKLLALVPAMESEPSALTGVELFIMSPEFMMRKYLCRRPREDWSQRAKAIVDLATEQRIAVAVE